MGFFDASEFLFVRHGQTDWNAAGKAQGAADIPLNAIGRDQARDVGLALRRVALDHIASSPLSRAWETAQIISRILEVPVSIEPELTECSFGALEGATHAASAQFDAYWSGASTPAGAEPVFEFRERVKRGLMRAIDRPGLTLVVSHGAVWRALSQSLRFQPNRRLSNAQPARMRLDGAVWRHYPLYEAAAE